MRIQLHGEITETLIKQAEDQGLSPTKYIINLILNQESSLAAMEKQHGSTKQNK